MNELLKITINQFTKDFPNGELRMIVPYEASYNGKKTTSAVIHCEYVDVNDEEHIYQNADYCVSSKGAERTYSYENY